MSSGIFSKLSLGRGGTGQEHLVNKQKVLNDEYKKLEEFEQLETLGTSVLRGICWGGARGPRGARAAACRALPSRARALPGGSQCPPGGGGRRDRRRARCHGTFFAFRPGFGHHGYVPLHARGRVARGGAGAHGMAPPRS